MSTEDKIEKIISSLNDLKSSIGSDSKSQHSGIKKILELAAVTALHSDLEEFGLLNSLLNCAMNVVKAEGAGLTLYDNDKEALVFRAAVGLGSEGIIGYEVPQEGSVHGIAFSMRCTQISIPQHEISEESTKAVFRNVMVAPLFADDEAIGTISVVNKYGDENFTQEDRQAFENFALVAADSIEQHEKLSYLKSIISEEKFSPKINTQISLIHELIPELVKMAEEGELEKVKEVLKLL